MPLLSIITVNLNNRAGLVKTLESVKIQHFKDFEYLIIDGGSTDGSLDIIKENKNLIDFWISEKDQGIYDAMNKGIKKAGGKYLLFLNSGDYLFDVNSLDIDSFESNQDIIYGNLTYSENDKIYEVKIPQVIDLGFFYRSSLPHCSTFLKKELFDKYGVYSTEYKIISDWIFFFICILINNCSYSYLNRRISVLTVGGISTIPENKHLIQSEREKYLSSILQDYILKYLERKRFLDDEIENLKYRNKELLEKHVSEMLNIKRLKGFKCLKKINNLFDMIYKQVRK